MYSLAFLSSVIILSTYYFAAKPLLDYIRDPKGLRRHPNYNLLCGISNIGWRLEAWRGGIRSKRPGEMHKTHPVIRIGPNSLLRPPQCDKGHIRPRHEMHQRRLLSETSWVTYKFRECH